MFAYTGNTINLPAVTTLVATPLPNSIALRAPYDSVSPSVSSAQLDNNASGNRNPLPKDNAQQNVIVNSASENFSAIAASTNSPTYTANAQTSFLAQLAGGDISSEVRGLFAQYDKMVSFSNVKYKPSNAGKPVDPVSVFKTLLEMEKESASHNLPEELPVNFPSDLPFVQNISSAPTVESKALQEVQLPQSVQTERRIDQEESVITARENAIDSLNQAIIKLYNSAIDQSRYIVPTEVEVA